MNKDKNKIYTGTANRPLALKVATALRVQLGSATVSTFSDGETRVEVYDSVRGINTFIIQPTSTPTNDTLMELLCLVDALKRASAKTVVAVIPYFGYSRQDRRPGYSRVPITAKLVASMLETAGVDHIVVVDLHAAQIQGFFKGSIDNLSAIPLFVADIYRNYIDSNPIIVSPDVGGVARARSLAKDVDNLDLAIVDKRRPKANESEVMNIIGDVEGKTCLLVDDIIDTAGTIGKAADALIDRAGASQVVAYATHPVLSGNAIENIEKSKIKEIVVTDTIQLPQHLQGHPKIRQVSVAAVIAETIDRIANKKSVSNFMG